MPSTKGIGTKATGVVQEEDGPFRCDHCTWWKHLASSLAGACGHPEVIADKEVPKIETSEGKKAKLYPGQCCNEFRPLRRIDEVKFSDVGL